MKPLYMLDSYKKELETNVIESHPEGVVLEDTIFYPTGGGQPCDTGKISSGNLVYDVASVVKYGGSIIHHIASHRLDVGDVVTCAIDWERRYKMMRMHTAAHIIDAVLYKEVNALCTGNQLGPDISRIDFSIENFDLEKVKEYIKTASEIARQDIEVKIYFLNREEAMKIPGVVKLANAMPPNIEELRIVEIPGIDIQADGGTQVKRTGEIGEIEFVSAENKGRQNRRIYYSLKQ